MRRGAAVAALILALLAAAVVLALLATSVSTLDDDLDTRAARLAQPGPPPATPEPSGWDARVARSLLGVDDELELLRTLERFDRARQSQLTEEEQLEEHGEIEAALARLARDGDDLALRSRAANLNGVLLVEDASLEPTGASRFLQLGLESFREAVLLDPENEEAKANLELVYQLTGLPNSPYGPDRRPGGSHSGASATSPGHGY